MMLSAVVHDALGPLVSGRVHPNAFPETDEKTAPKWPAIRYTIVDAEGYPTLCGTDDVEADDTRVQFDVVAKTYGAMIKLRDQVIAAMQSTDPPCSRVGYFETYDTDFKVHRAVLDYLFQASSSS